MRHLALMAFSAFFLASIPGASRAHEFFAGDLRIIHPWSAVVSSDSRACAVYVVIMTQGADDRLLGASSPAARVVRIQPSMAEDNVMNTQPIDGILFSADKPILFTPAGAHLMLSDLPGPLLVDTFFPLILHFERTGDVTVNVQVQDDGSKPEHEHQEHAH